MRRGIMANHVLKMKKRRKVENCCVSSMDLTSLLPDDMLIEVFLRLRDAHSLLLSATVCKRWCSLILTPEFSLPQQQFFEYHRLYHTDHAFSILFKFSPFDTEPGAYPYKFHRLKTEHYHQLSSNGCRPYSLSFISNSARLIIRASSGDLLLLSEGGRQFFICNSLTKLWFRLPKTISIFDPSSGFALVRRLNYLHHLGWYRVVLVKSTLFVDNSYYCILMVFDSTIRRWIRTCVVLMNQRPGVSCSTGINLEILNPGDGALYWLDGNRRNYDGLISLDAFSLKLRLIPLPQGEFNGHHRYKFNRSGVVRGRIRLSRSTMEGNGFRLRVWELDCRYDTWSLDYGKIVPNIPRELCFVVGFDPNDGEWVFLVRDSEVFRYQIGKDEYEKICEFPRCSMSTNKLKKRIRRYLKVLTLVHPFWPTPIPPTLAPSPTHLFRPIPKPPAPTQT